ncbi:MAG: VWA domain-containing protein [Bacteroidales bacterium]|nr:VWA domain-containing protein [Bacteroidales bacterium]
MEKNNIGEMFKGFMERVFSENDGMSAQKDAVYNIIVLDSSGSMSAIRQATVNGLNETLESVRQAQRQYGTTQQHYVSLLLFCGCKMEYVYERTPIDKVRNLSPLEFRPCCGTPLYDAIGRSISDMLTSDIDLRQAAVIATVITDGMENSSKTFTSAKARQLVERMKNDYGWNFSYLGANHNVNEVSHGLSIDNHMSFDYSDTGASDAFRADREARLHMIAEMHAMSEAMPDDRAKRMSIIHEMLRTRRNFDNAPHDAPDDGTLSRIFHERLSRKHSTYVD